MGILLDLEKERLRDAIAAQKIEIENLKAELEAAYESRKLIEAQRYPTKHAYESGPNGESHTHQACSNCLPLKTRKPREQEMNEKKMGC